MSDFVKQRGADFRPEDLRVVFREIPEIFQPKPNARSWCFRCALVKQPQRIGLNPLGDVRSVRPTLEENGHPFYNRANFHWKAQDRGANFRLRDLRKHRMIHFAFCVGIRLAFDY